MKFVYKKVLDMEYSEDAAEIYYEDNSHIKVDFKDNKYEIVFEGKKIAWDYNTFAQNGNNYYLYSRGGVEQEFCLPKEWKDVAVFVITEKGRADRKIITTNGGKFSFKADPKVAYVFEKI
jgi:hypothetical protein